MKAKTSVTVDKAVLEAFNKVCKENFINKSAYLQAMMQELVEKFDTEKMDKQ